MYEVKKCMEFTSIKRNFFQVLEGYVRSNKVIVEEHYLQYTFGGKEMKNKEGKFSDYYIVDILRFMRNVF